MIMMIAAPVQAKDYQAGTYLATDYILIRKQPKAGGSRLGVISKGKKFKVKKVVKHNWGQITFKGKSAYVNLYHTKYKSAKKKKKKAGKKKAKKAKGKKGKKSQTVTYKLKGKACLYQKASKKSKKLKKLKKGTKVKVSQVHKKSWLKVTYKKKTGYIYVKGASKIKSTKVVVSTKTKKTKAFMKSVGKKAANAAKKKIGCRYVFGASHTEEALQSKRTKVFDCSSLVCWAYYQAGYDDIGSQTTKMGLYRYGKNVVTYGGRKKKPSTASSFDKILKVGDILIFSNNNRVSGIHHTGIYIGHGRFVHAPNKREKVKTETILSGKYHRQLYTVRRINS